MRLAAVVPMRHTSERVPEKTYRPFAGRPLYHHVVEMLLSCEVIDLVVIDTDSPVVMEETPTLFPQVRLLERPEHLRAGEIPMNEVLLHSTGEVAADFYLQTHVTNPLLTAETVRRACEAFVGAENRIYDSLFGVTPLHTRLWDGLARPINHNPAILLRTQDLPPVYEENSCVYIFTRELLERRHSRIGERPMLFEIDALEAWDIDEELDFEVAEILYEKRRRAAPGN